jgi:hypothetical protein
VGSPLETPRPTFVAHREALANPEALDLFASLPELES